VTALLISLVTFAFVFGGALLGMYLRNALSEDNLREDVRDVIKLSSLPNLLSMRIRRRAARAVSILRAS
jgi:hypothetical protein